jgi:hypothetical protein
VISPLGPLKGGSYVEPTIDNFITEDINQLYRTIVHEKYYINPNKDGMLSWRSISSCDSDFDTRLENWQQRLHELSTRRCVIMTCMLRWIGSKVRDTPTFYGMDDLEEILMRFESKVVENKILLVLDISLKVTSARWWGTHKEKINKSFQCKRLLCRVGEQSFGEI